MAGLDPAVQEALGSMPAPRRFCIRGKNKGREQLVGRYAAIMPAATAGLAALMLMGLSGCVGAAGGYAEAYPGGYYYYPGYFYGYGYPYNHRYYRHRDHNDHDGDDDDDDHDHDHDHDHDGDQGQDHDHDHDHGNGGGQGHGPVIVRGGDQGPRPNGDQGRPVNPPRPDVQRFQRWPCDTPACRLQ